MRDYPDRMKHGLGLSVSDKHSIKQWELDCFRRHYDSGRVRELRESVISPDEMRRSDGVGDSAEIVPYLQRVVGSVESSLIQLARVYVLVSEVPLGSSSLYLSFRGKSPKIHPMARSITVVVLPHKN